MAEPKPLVISDWYKGMGLSAHTGFELLKCLDINEYGVLKMNRKPSALAIKTGEAYASLPTWIDRGRSSTSARLHIAICNGAIKYYNSTNAEWTNIGSTNSDGRGAGIFGGSNTTKDFLIFTNGADLKALDISSYASPTFTTIAGTLEANATYRPMTLAINNALYIGNRRYIAELIEIDGQTFAPGTGTTFTFTRDKFAVPSNCEVSALGQMGSYLIAGTTEGDLYFWNMETVTDDTPFPERKVVGGDGNISNIISHKNVVYFQAGNKGRWYYTTGITANKCAEIPKGLLSSTVSVKPFSCVVIDDKVYFGVSPTSSTDMQYAGIWSFDTQKVGQLTIPTGVTDPTDLGVQACIMEHKVTTDYTEAIEIGGMFRGGLSAVLPADSGSGLLYGMSQTGDTDYYNIEQTSAYVYSDSDCIMMSPLYKVGTRRNKRTFKAVEMQLAKPLPTNYSVTLYYRTNNSPSTSWSALATFNTATETSFVADRAISADKIQVKAVIDAPATDSTNIDILDITLY